MVSIVGINDESLAEKHTVCLYHKSETKCYRLDMTGTRKFRNYFFLIFSADTKIDDAPKSCSYLQGH